MHRLMLQIYSSNTKEAVPFYAGVFDAEPQNVYKLEDGSYYHSEMDLDGKGNVLAVGHTEDREQVAGNRMQFCLHYTPEEKDTITLIYQKLKIEAEILHPLGPTDFSSYMCDLIDRFGVRWCIFC